MEPKPITPHTGLEMPSRMPDQNPDSYIQDEGLRPVEAIPVGSQEKVEQRSEQALAAAVSAGVSANPVLPSPIVDDGMSVGLSPAVDDGMPIIANDDDLIEKEWVDKAKKIILETKDDPYRREQEVNKLQADYLRKRYGRELGVS